MSLPPWKARASKPALPDPVTAQVRGLVQARTGRRCELCLGIGQHLHHRQLRRGGDHSAANLVLLCHECHRRVHGHASWSYEHGWLVSQYASSALVPLFYGERWVLLDAAGQVLPVRGPSHALNGPAPS